MVTLIESMSVYRLTYLVVFTSAFLLGLGVKKYHKTLYILLGVMALGLAAEVLVEVNKELDFTTEAVIYNVYIPLEYLLYAAFFYFVNKNKKLRRVILISIPIFLLVLAVMKFWKESPVSSVDLATEIYTLSGILITAWSLWTLFVLSPVKEMKLIKHPLIWICIGLIIFYSGITPFNLAYNALKSTDSFEPLSRAIQKGFNVFLYLCLAIGFICSHRMKIWTQN